MKVTICAFTQKMGSIPSVSLSPAMTCNPGLTCWRLCYARRFMAIRPSMAKTWADNTQVAMTYCKRFFLAVAGSLAAELPPFFRWHVGGEMPDQDYFGRMCGLARDFPRTRFLCFTRRHDLNLRRPDNLNVVASVWPGHGDVSKLRRRGLPIAWMQDGTETRLPVGVKVCQGHCSACRHCLKPGAKDVCFLKH